MFFLFFVSGKRRRGLVVVGMTGMKKKKKNKEIKGETGGKKEGGFRENEKNRKRSVGTRCWHTQWQCYDRCGEGGRERKAI